VTSPPRRPLMGLAEISDYYAITRQLAQKWATRSDFPEPLDHLRSGRIWDRDEVLAWGRKHGRRKGAGPGAPKAPVTGGSGRAGAT